MTASADRPPARSGLPAALVAASAHVFVDDLHAPVPTDDDLHHLGRVLRLRDGEPVTACDGEGAWRKCSFVRGGLEVRGEIVRAPLAVPPVTVAFAVPKGERPELIVQKLTEIGADVIVPMTTDRTIVRWDADRSARNAERLRRVAREASMQSRRVWLPTVEPVTKFGDVVTRRGATLAIPGGAPLSIGPDGLPLVLVGPEGGWSDAELGLAPATVDLGDQVLRTETAAIVACTLLVATRARSVDG